MPSFKYHNLIIYNLIISLFPYINISRFNYFINLDNNDGFAMKQGILIKGRIRLILEPGTSGFICQRVGGRRRKGVRGCIVGTDISVLHVIIVKKGDADIEGLTNVNIPRRLGPKRANKIRRMFILPKHSDKVYPGRK